MKIEIVKLTEKGLTEKGVFSWPIWACEISEFDWEYGEQESCLLLEGEVEVKTGFDC